MKIKTSELSGAQLDWAVAQIEGLETEFEDGPLFLRGDYYNDGDPYKPSEDWAQGGPIIEREGIALGQTADGWEATCDGDAYVYGKTPLVAAMRCYVFSELGDEVEVPDGLA